MIHDHPYVLRLLDHLAVAMWAAAEPAGAQAEDFINIALRHAKQGTPPTVEIPPPKVTVKRAAREKREDDTGFAEFWSLYPRKEGKHPARKVWMRLHGSFDMAKITAALPAFIASDQWQRDRGLYIPHAATWLNQRRFEELPPAGKRAPTKADARAEVADQLFKRGNHVEPGTAIEGTVTGRSG